MPTTTMPQNLPAVCEVDTAVATDRFPPCRANSPAWHSGQSVSGVLMLTTDTQSGRRCGRCQCAGVRNVRRRDDPESPGDLHGGHRVHWQTTSRLDGGRRQRWQALDDHNVRHRHDPEFPDDQNDRHRSNPETPNDLHVRRFHDSESINRRNTNYLRDGRRISCESHALGRRDALGRPECPLGQPGAWIQSGPLTVNKYPHLTTQTPPYQPAGLRKYTGGQ